MNPLLVTNDGDPVVLAVGWALLLSSCKARRSDWRSQSFFALARRSPEMRYAVACIGLVLLMLAPVEPQSAASRPAPRARTWSRRKRQPSRRLDAVMPATIENRTPSRVKASSLNHRRWSRRGSASASNGLLGSLRPVPTNGGSRVEPWLPTLVACWIVGVLFFSIRLLCGLGEMFALTR